MNGLFIYLILFAFQTLFNPPESVVVDFFEHQTFRCSHGNGEVLDFSQPFPLEAFQRSPSATIQVNYSGFNQQEMDAFDYAASVWESVLNSEVPISINATMIFLPSGTLGFTAPNADKNFPGAVVDSVWYPSSLANALAGTDTKPGEGDIDVFMSSQISWYLGTDANPPVNQYDFVSVAIHEIAHGLGFVETLQQNEDSIQYGRLTAQDIILPLSFTFEDLEDDPFIYSTFLENGQGQSLLDTVLFPNNSLQLANFVTSPVFFDGPFANSANGGLRPRIYSPANFAFGSSIVHLDEVTNPPAGGNSLMTPFISLGEGNHVPGPVMLGILQDIGWTLDFSTSVESPEESLQAFHIYPVPGNGLFFLDLVDLNELDVKVHDLGGKLLRALTIKDPEIDLRELPPGAYVLSFFEDGSQVNSQVVQIVR